MLEPYQNSTVHTQGTFDKLKRLLPGSTHSEYESLQPVRSRKFNTPSLIASGNRTLLVTYDGKLVIWGRGDYQEAQSTPTLQQLLGRHKVVAVSAGFYDNMVLFDNGKVYSWGNNSILNLPEDFQQKPIIAIAGSDIESLFVYDDYSVRARSNLIPKGLKGVHAVAAGRNHSLAQLENGELVGWGFNDSGQATVPSNLGKVIAFSAGAFHSVAIRLDGSLVIWGDEAHQALFQDLPASVRSQRFIGVSAGSIHNLAITENGQVIAWGDNKYGQCDVPADLHDVVEVAVGWRHSVALQKDGKVVEWGDMYRSSEDGKPIDKKLKPIEVPSAFQKPNNKTWGPYLKLKLPEEIISF